MNNLSKLFGAICLTTFSAVSQAGTWTQANSSVSFPNPNSSYLKHPSSIPMDNLNAVEIGQNAEQVVKLLGWSHFGTGMFASSAHLNYLYKQEDGRLCQYQVQLKHSRVAAMYTNCTAPVAKKEAAPAVQTITLGADALFKFGGGMLKDIAPAGREQLNKVVSTLRSGDVQNILVTGYTDRIGSDAANMKLSQMRAATLKSYFTSAGIPASVIRTQGMGESKPVVNCPGPKSAAVIQCLAPNRRVEIQYSFKKTQ